ncbi:MAG: BTAD domain-containing putative transcriptional regulator [Candidatus Eremiobacterota bacterium]
MNTNSTQPPPDFESYLYYLGLGDRYREHGDTVLALQCYATTGSLARAQSNPAVEAAALGKELEVHLQRWDASSAVQVFLDLERLAPHAAYPTLRDGCLASRELLRRITRELRERHQFGTAARVLLEHCYTTLIRMERPEHLEALAEWMEVLDRADGEGLLRVCREAMIAVLLSAVVHRVQPERARELLGMAPAQGPARPMIRFLGPLIVEGSGTLSAEGWPSRKAMRLFALLASRRGGRVPSSAVCELLWPELAEPQARKCLRNCIHQVRRVLSDLGVPGGGLTRCRRLDTLSLDFDCDTDVDRFERLVAQADAAPAADALTRLEEGLRLVRGDYLQGLGDEWVSTPRAAWEDSLIGCRLRCGQRLLELGRWREAEEAGRRALQEDNLREEGWSILLESLVRQGRESEAMRAYRDAVALYELEIGCRPDRLGQDFDRLFAPGRSLSPTPLEGLIGHPKVVC